MSGLHMHVPGRMDVHMSGGDSVIVKTPADFYAEVEGQRVLVVPVMSRTLRKLAEDMAERNGEVLHHAMFILTGDAEEIRAHAPMHDCPSCNAAVDQAVALVSDPANAGVELIVGQLYWAEA